jgi:hypothetical protein
MGVVWQFSKLGLGVTGPGFDASPYLMPLLGFRLFSSAHELAFRMNGLFFIGEFDELVLAVVWPTSLGLKGAVLAMARFTFAGARALVLAVAGGALEGPCVVVLALVGFILMGLQSAVVAAVGPALVGLGGLNLIFAGRFGVCGVVFLVVELNFSIAFIFLSLVGVSICFGFLLLIVVLNCFFGECGFVFLVVGLDFIVAFIFLSLVGVSMCVGFPLLVVVLKIAVASSILSFLGFLKETKFLTRACGIFFPLAVVLVNSLLRYFFSSLNLFLGQISFRLR